MLDPDPRTANDDPEDTDEPVETTPGQAEGDDDSAERLPGSPQG